MYILNNWYIVLIIFFVFAKVIAAYHCPFNGSPGWPDVCDGKTDNKTCKPFSPLPHDGSYKSWISARANLIKKLWGGGSPPTRIKPDVGPTRWHPKILPHDFSGGGSKRASQHIY